MNENGRKRREWVKTVAIIFLSVLLVLTFFSNTIMNYSLPEVAAQYVQSGTITAKIRGNGVVESSDPYNVMVKQTRKVASVAVREGDQVQKGDVLVYLDDEESEELKAAQDALKMAQEAYDLALLAADVNAGIIQNSHSDISTTSYRQQIDAAQAEVLKAQKEVDELQEEYNDISTQLAITPSNDADIEDETNAYKEAKKNKENADFALTAADNALKHIDAQLAYAESVSTGDAEDYELINSLTAQKQQAERALIDAQEASNNAALAYDRAKLAMENKVAEGDTTGTVNNLTAQQTIIKVNLDEATIVDALPYYRIRTITLILPAMISAYSSILRCYGITKPGVYSGIISNVINLVICFATVNLFADNREVLLIGIAFAFVLGQIGGMCYIVVCFRLKKIGFTRPESFKNAVGYLWNIL
ncbi:MAG: biotin/lipoyl-binding protein, partial [Lachnospiraceae bacterium]|nr:biotin/lipoyl-binding protein [Lachnospiraceae bacterium]